MKPAQFCSYALVFLTIVVLDLWSKLWALAACQKPRIVTQFLSLHVTCNTGVAWSLGANAQNFSWLLMMAAIFTVVGMLIYRMLERIQEQYTVWPEVIILAGACGNIIDRLWHGAVIDFIAVGYRAYTWPIFNIADIAVVVGVAGMVLCQLQDKRHEA